MTSQQLPDGLSDDARWLAQAIDPAAGLIRFVEMHAAAYRDAAFLDDRLLQNPMETRLCSLDAAMAAAATVKRDDAAWIFHIGHVGSTLISRLLGELGGILAIREPRSLRDLGAADGATRPELAKGLRRLMSRVFGPDQRALVKATSFVSEWARWLMAPNARALFLYATPRNYIASILAGENSVKELAALHEFRAQRLRDRGISLNGFDLNDAHRAAAAWACEMTSLESAAENRTDALILWADFDAMLADMAMELARCAGHFGLAAPGETFTKLVEGPLMRRYSKALEFDYSPALRAELLAEAEREHCADIDAAIGALQQAASAAPHLARALDRAEREC